MSTARAERWPLFATFAPPSDRTNKPQDLKAPIPNQGHIRCISDLLPTRDTLEILSGKWKILIIVALAVKGRSRFMELVRDIGAITPKMLSKELRDLEQNDLVSRSVQPTIPVTVEYELTEYGRTLKPVLVAMRDWGTTHRARMTGKATPKKRKKAA
ncbi:MAG: helix-turn-helix transcriptional regulator [Flavobacteriales bacterium]|nr:helix-turn-helix transcriptional regulator [Flavobacteriales bacterium]MBP6391127.1 helix-turn-helix transcriptional regulator [Flavobacteriales bacterium]MBP6696722.1 helix-turn-helix transcriptional regulator [Flavobacteriales bacterium]